MIDYLYQKLIEIFVSLISLYLMVKFFLMVVGVRLTLAGVLAPLKKKEKKR